MSGSRYVIADEPQPTALQQWVVDPFWPFLGLMLGGLWLALPWYVFNGIALGSPTRRREWLALACALFGSVLLLVLILHAVRVGWISGIWIQLTLLSLTAVKLAMGFVVYLQQSRSFELWQHFGGVPRNPLLIVIASIFVERWLFQQFDSVFIKLVLG